MYCTNAPVIQRHVLQNQCAQEELSMTRQKLVGWKLMFLKASTSPLTVPNVLFGRCFIPS
jgi:hypothetical protein